MDASTPDCSAVGVRVGTNSDALGFNEAELGLTEATAVGAAIWRIAENFDVLLGTIQILRNQKGGWVGKAKCLRLLTRWLGGCGKMLT